MNRQRITLISLAIILSISAGVTIQSAPFQDGHPTVASGLTPSDSTPAQSGITASLSPTHGTAGSLVTVSGRVIPGNPIRILFRECDVTMGLAETPVGPDGRFSQVVRIPNDASLGPHVISIVSGRGGGGQLLMTDVPFIVEPRAALFLTGVVMGLRPNGQMLPEPDVNIKVTPGTAIGGLGQPILARTITNSQGRFTVQIIDVGLVGSYCFRIAPSKQGMIFEQPIVEPPAEGKIAQSLTILGTNFNALRDPLPSFVTPPPMFARYEQDSGSLAPCSAPVDIGQFVSMPGRGVLAFTNEFSVIMPYVVPQEQAVEFQFSSSGVLRTVQATSNDRTIWVASANMSAFPPGRFGVSVRVTGPGATAFRDSLEFTMIQAPWFNAWVGDVGDMTPRVKINTTTRPAQYEFAGRIPASSRFDFRDPIRAATTIAYDVSFDYIVNETLKIDGTWTGSSRLLALGDVQLFGQSMRSIPMQPGPGGSYANRSFAFRLQAGRLESPEELWFSLPFPNLRYQDLPGGVYMDPYSSGFSLWYHIQTYPTLILDSVLNKDLYPSLSGRIQVRVSAPLRVQLQPQAGCSREFILEPRAGSGVEMNCNLDQSNCFVNGCLEFEAVGKIATKCAYGSYQCPGNVGCWSTTQYEDLDVGRVQWGNCQNKQSGSDGYNSAATQQQQIAVAPPSPSPSVAGNGQGRALAVWTQDDSTDSTRPRPYVYFSTYNGTNWSAPSRVVDKDALVESPDVAFLGPNRAVTVWVQNKLTWEQLPMMSVYEAITQSELYYAIWDGTRWSAPAPVTNDRAIDTPAALTADPATGRALLVWHRADPVGTPILGVYWSSFDGRRWTPPAAIDPSSTVVDHQPDVQFDQRGQALAMWARDVDRNLMTSEDRQIMTAQFDGRAWTTPIQIPNLPAGAYAPSLAFDRNNNPLVAFVVPPRAVDTGQLATGGSTNSALYAAYRRGTTWEVTPVGTNTYAEGPVVNVNSDNRAIIMYRQFGQTGDVHVSGDLASAVADLNVPRLEWTTGYLTADGQTNWDVAFDIDRQTSKNFVVNVKQIPGANGKADAAAEMLSRWPGGDHVGGAMQTDQWAQSPTAAVASTVVPYTTDLRATSDDINVSNSHPLEGEQTMITANARNIGLKATTTPFTVKFYDGASASGRLLYEQRISTPARFNLAVPLSFSYTVQRGGLQTITVVVDQENAVSESDERNNTASLTFGQMPAPNLYFVNAEPDQRVMSLGWTAPETKGIDHCEIFRSTTAGRDYEFVGDTTATEFVDSLVRPGVTYYYVVVVVDIYGTRSVFSNEAGGKLEIRNPKSETNSNTQ